MDRADRLADRSPRPRRDPAAVFVRWATMRSFVFRGYWLVTSVYLVVTAELSPFQLVFAGTAMEITLLLAEVPTGVMADTASRKWSIVVSHVVMGAGMATTGLVTAFPAIVASQMLWGLGWTFASGADIAWVTDELDQPERIGGVLTRRVRFALYGGAAGMAAFGSAAWAVGLGVAIVVAGVVMAAIGGYVALCFDEHRFTPAGEHRVRESAAIFRRGVALARRDHEILLVFAATMLLSVGAEAFDRLHPKRLIELGFPDEPDPIVWFTALGIATLAVGSISLRVLERRIDDDGTPRRVYAGAIAVGVVGMSVLAHAPDATTGLIGTLVVAGVAWEITRAVGAIWVNRRTSSGVRATVQSFLGQVESVGEITGGLLLGAVAQTVSITVALTCSSACLALAFVVVVRSRAGRAALVVGADGPAARDVDGHAPRGADRVA